MNNVKNIGSSKTVLIGAFAPVFLILLIALFAIVGVTSGGSFAYAEVAEYDITFLNGDGSVLYQTTAEEGVVPTCADTPVKATDTYLTYTFDYWYNADTPEVMGITSASGDATYVPHFSTAKTQFNFALVADQTNVTYGTAVELSASYDCLVSEELTYEYTWIKDSKVLSNTSNKLALVNVSQSGTYTLNAVVTYPSGETASFSSASIAVAISPLEVAVEWDSATTVEYNGGVAVPNATAEAVKMILNDDGTVSAYPDTAIELTFTGGTEVAPRNYIAKAFTTDGNYKLTSAEKAYKIVPKTVAVQWQSAEVQYNGTAQHRLAKALGAKGEEIELSYNGSGVEPGEVYYTSVFTDNENYNLTNTEAEFTVIKRTVDVVWQLDSSYTYNGENQIDNLVAVFDNGAGIKNRLKITMEVPDKADEEVFKNAGFYTVNASLPESYQNYYTLSANSELTKTVRMQKAEPRLVVTSTDLHFIFDGNPKSIDASLSSGEEIIYTINGKKVLNSFVQAGSYAVVVKSDASLNYLPVAGIAVSLVIDITSTASKGGIDGSIANANGISPTATFALNDVTESMSETYAAKWSDELIEVVDISLVEDGRQLTLDGTSTVRLAVPKSLKDCTTVYINYTTDRYSSKFATVNVEEGGYITLSLDYLGQVAFYQSSVSEENTVTNKGTSNSIGGVIWWSALAGGCLILVIGLAIYFANRAKKIG